MIESRIYMFLSAWLNCFRSESSLSFDSIMWVIQAQINTRPASTQATGPQYKNVKRSEEPDNTGFWPINIENKHSHMLFKTKKHQIWYFSSVALQVPEPRGITLALDSVFSRSAWHLRLCRPTNLFSGRTPSSVLISKGTVCLFFVFFFTFSTVNIKQVQVVCHIVIQENT